MGMLTLEATKEEALKQIQDARDDNELSRVDVPHQLVLDHAEVILDALLSLVVDTIETNSWSTILFKYRFPLKDEPKIRKLAQAIDEWKKNLMDRLGFVDPDDVFNEPYQEMEGTEIVGNFWISFQYDIIVLEQGVTTEEAMERFQKARQNGRITKVTICHQELGLNQEILVGLKDLIVDTYAERKWKEVEFQFRYEWESDDVEEERGTESEGFKNYRETNAKYDKAMESWMQGVKESLGLADNDVTRVGGSSNFSDDPERRKIRGYNQYTFVHKQQG